MRRRKLFTLAAGASAALCIGSPVACVQSFRRPPMIYYYDWLDTRGPVQVRSVYAESINGVTHLTADRTIADTSEAATFLARRARGFQPMRYGGPLQSVRPWAPFRIYSLRRQNPSLGLTVEVRSIGVPYWFWTAACAVLPLTWVTRRRRERRRAQRLQDGRCPACGYDLRATPDRCPECGAVPATKGEQE